VLTGKDPGHPEKASGEYGGLPGHAVTLKLVGMTWMTTMTSDGALSDTTG
jgi:hypothetical protein